MHGHAERLAVSDPDADPPPVAKAKLVATNDDVGVYRIFADQTKKEDDLINYRMTWCVTINGGIFAIIAALFDKIPAKDAALENLGFITLALAAIVISVVTILSIVAANRQLTIIKIDYKDNWGEYFHERHLPVPFWDGMKEIKKRDDYAKIKHLLRLNFWHPQIILITVIILWLLFLGLAGVRLYWWYTTLWL